MVNTILYTIISARHVFNLNLGFDKIPKGPESAKLYRYITTGFDVDV